MLLEGIAACYEPLPIWDLDGIYVSCSTYLGLVTKLARRQVRMELEACQGVNRKHCGLARYLLLWKLYTHQHTDWLLRLSTQRQRTCSTACSRAVEFWQHFLPATPACFLSPRLLPIPSRLYLRQENRSAYQIPGSPALLKLC